MDEVRESNSDGAEPVIVSSIDQSGGYDQFRIANAACDDQWLGIRHSEALSLRAWQ